MVERRRNNLISLVEAATTSRMKMVAMPPATCRALQHRRSPTCPRDWDRLRFCSRLRRRFPTRHHGTNCRSRTRTTACGSIPQTLRCARRSRSPIFISGPFSSGYLSSLNL
ncbi:unnamed protein product, partial [Ectocarpus sp. 12 AP-2014]